MKRRHLWGQWDKLEERERGAGQAPESIVRTHGEEQVTGLGARAGRRACVGVGMIELRAAATCTVRFGDHSAPPVSN